MSRKPRKPQRYQAHAVLPEPLDRPPHVELAVSMRELDERTFAAVEAVAVRLAVGVGKSLSMAEMQLLTTKAQLLRAMKSTHRSIRRLVVEKGEDLELSVDALPLTRLQLERCFLALLLDDNPGRWHSRYRKNAFKALAEKFFRDQHVVGHLEPYREYFGPNGAGIRALRTFSHEMDVSEDELQTLRMQVLNEQEEDPRWRKWFIPDMPTPGRCLSELTDATRKRLATLLYPYYDNLSHFSHGGLMGAMEAAILRPGWPLAGHGDVDKQQFWASGVMETTLPVSYDAIIFAATLFALPFLSEGQLAAPLLEAWQPYLCDGAPLGVALWDGWARDALEDDSAAATGEAPPTG